MNPTVLRALLLGGADPDARAWKAAAIANGGTVSGLTLNAVSRFCKSAKAAGYWSKLNRINLFCGDNLNACLVPLKVGGGNATDTNVNFVAGDYTEATGLTGNGSTKYLRTGIIPSSMLTQNDTHLSAYNRAGSAVGGGCALGGNNSTSAYLALIPPYSNGLAYSQNIAGDVLKPAVSAPYGLFVGSRVSAVSHVLYKNGAAIGSELSGGGSMAQLSGEITVFARRDQLDASPSLYSAHPLAMYSIGSGLSAADVTAYNTHVQAFQSALSRNV